MTFQVVQKIMCIVLAEPHVQIALERPTLFSRPATPSRLRTWFQCWRRPTSMSTPSSFSWLNKPGACLAKVCITTFLLYSDTCRRSYWNIVYEITERVICKMLGGYGTWLLTGRPIEWSSWIGTLSGIWIIFINFVLLLYARAIINVSSFISYGTKVRLWCRLIYCFRAVSCWLITLIIS